MSTLSNILLDKEILLESGTNELELLVFELADYTFGINVAKVREVMPTVEITSLPRAHPSIRGVFKLRSQVIPCVSLMDHLGITPTRETSESTMILTDFNQQQTAFLVDAVDRIYRLSWQNILAVPGLEALANTPVTALARCEGRLIVMLDFEKVLDDVTDQYFRTAEVDNPLGLPREDLRIILAEDSPTVRDAIRSALEASGYTRLTFFDNGAEAWSWIERRLAETGKVEDVGDLVISDVEMPQVDGFHLTRRIKQHPELRQLPVLLYSSIVTPDNQKKGMAVGADAQVSKPELGKVVQLADELISTARRENRAAAMRKVTETLDDAAPSPPSASPPPAETPIEPPSETDSAPECQDETEPRGPKGVNPALWRTFHRELQGHAARLRTLLAQATAGRSESICTDILRTLHTVKSAAMVIPLDRLSHATHMAESLVEAARNGGAWPEPPLEHYLEWLDTLTSPTCNVDAALDAGSLVEEELAAVAV
ncbi:MAG: chemotaxis protein CheW [Planctomycetia bacterium]|nr:chemotaxis protein CheW [Planctomycetia bacterium]